MLRELERNEIGFVAGGEGQGDDIIVDGVRMTFLSDGTGYGAGNGQLFYNPEQYNAGGNGPALLTNSEESEIVIVVDGVEQVDTNGDRIPDSDIIVVTGAERVQVQSALLGDSYYYRYDSNLDVYYFFRDGYFSDTFYGTFVPDPNGNFTTVSPGYSFSVTVRGVPVTITSTPGSQETWTRVATPR